MMEKRVTEMMFCVVEFNSWHVPNFKDPTVHMFFIRRCGTKDKELDKMTNKKRFMG